MPDLNVSLDTSEIDEFMRAMPREIFNATRSAIRTTTTFAEKELEKRMADATNIPLKVFKITRILSKASDTGGTVWFGFKPIKAKFVGKMEETGTGATAGSYFFQGGFIASINGGLPNMFKRVGQARFPIATQFVELPQAIPITEDVAELSKQELFTRFSAKINAYIEKRESAA